VLIALGELCAADSSAAIEPHLHDEVAAIRFQAVIAYARASPDHEAVVEALLAATEDEDPLVCHIALRMAEERGDERLGTAAQDSDAQDSDAQGSEAQGSEAQDSDAQDTDAQDGIELDSVDARLVERAGELLDHDDHNVALVSAVIRARAGHDDGAKLLVAAACREIEVREADDEAAAIELCGVLRLKRARRCLERRAFGGWFGLGRDPFTWHARVALAAMGHPRAERWALDQLGSWNRERRTLAVAAAGRARVPAALPVIRAMRGRPERADQGAVEQALLALEDEPSS
jgi:hypothetical protein